MGTPATATLSLMATVRPTSGPLLAPSIRTRQAQAPSRFSSGRGAAPPSRGYRGCRLGSSSSRHALLGDGEVELAGDRGEVLGSRTLHGHGYPQETAAAACLRVRASGVNA